MSKKTPSKSHENTKLQIEEYQQIQVKVIKNITGPYHNEVSVVRGKS